MKKILLFIVAATFATFFLVQCNNNGNNPSEAGQAANTSDSATNGKSLARPVVYKFPETEATIQSWITNNDFASIYAHGWGIWSDITKYSGQTSEGENLRVFESWPTIDDIVKSTSTGTNFKSLFEAVSHPRASFHLPNQFLHNKNKAMNDLKRAFAANPDLAIVVDVRYNPAAADFAINNKILKKSVLDSLLNSKQTAIPNFPTNSITLKPTYKIISKAHIKNGYYAMEAWNGPPADTIGYPENDWNSCIYIDMSNKSNGDGSVDKGCNNRQPNNTYNLNDFIHFTVDKKTALLATRELGFTVNEGDIAILVAMHVTSREITRWTWQTFWWAPNAVAPPLPSSKAIADARPAQLQGAQAHYAMSIGYTFIDPDQPITDGSNKGTSIYVYNPYLEARFGSDAFNTPAYVVTNGVNISNNVGVRTNCMSCHAGATYNPKGAESLGYTGDTYVDIRGPLFQNQLSVDFSWSIVGHLVQ